MTRPTCPACEAAGNPSCIAGDLTPMERIYLLAKHINDADVDLYPLEDAIKRETAPFVKMDDSDTQKRLP